MMFCLNMFGLRCMLCDESLIPIQNANAFAEENVTLRSF